MSERAKRQVLLWLGCCKEEVCDCFAYCGGVRLDAAVTVGLFLPRCQGDTNVQRRHILSSVVSYRS